MADLIGPVRFLDPSSMQLKEGVESTWQWMSWLSVFIVLLVLLWVEKNKELSKMVYYPKQFANWCVCCTVLCWIPHLLCFLQMERYSCTSSGDPRTTGTRWWMEVGWMSRTFMDPVVAMPPACSTMKAMGLHSYNSLSWRGRSRNRSDLMRKWMTNNLYVCFY